MDEFELTPDEIIEMFRFREINSKTNNLIVTGVENFEILNKIPKQCDFTFASDVFYGTVPTEAFNVLIDLRTIKLKDILTVALTRTLALSEPLQLDFDEARSIYKLNGILQTHKTIIQFIFFGLESLSLEDSMLLNELFYHTTAFFSVSAFINEKHLKTYFIPQGRALDRRENYLQLRMHPYSNTTPSQKADKKTTEKTLNFTPKTQQ